MGGMRRFTIDFGALRVCIKPADYESYCLREEAIIVYTFIQTNKRKSRREK